MVSDLEALEFSIASAQNRNIKLALQLRDRRDRDRHGLYIIEGYRELTRYLSSEVDRVYFPPWQSLFYCPELFLGEGEFKVVRAAKDWGTKLLRTTKRLFAKIAYRDRPEGLLAIAQINQRPLHSLRLSARPVVAIAESIEKPGNLGTLLRSADGAGVDALILGEARTDLWNPNTVRASTGMLFTLPVVGDSNSAIWNWLMEAQLPIIAAIPDATESAFGGNLRAPCAIALGAEQTGLSAFWRQRAHRRVALPMRGCADSLNVAVAGALMFYEARRGEELACPRR